MFQTEINHFFQSFESPALTTFMRYVTALGYTEFFLAFLIFFLLAIDFKKAFILFQVLMWTAVVTLMAKEFFALPRPFHVDNTLQFLDGQLPDANTFSFSKRGAASFWEPLPAEVVEETRKAEHLEYGFPSGHTSIAIALWGTLLCLYQEKWIKGICIALMVLIPLSRMYLGVHFLADVAGGTALGGLMWLLIYHVISKKTKLQAFMQQDYFPIGFNPLSIFLLVSPFLLLLVLPSKLYILPAFMLGFGLGFLLVGHNGIPLSEGNLGMRIGRLIIGVALFASVGYLLKVLATSIGVDKTTVGDFFQNMVGGLVLVWGASEIAIRLGWFKRIGKEA